MNPIAKQIRKLVFLAAAAAATHASAGPIDCARPAIGNGEAQACRAASQSVDDLRRFIERTRGIYILYLHDFENAIRQG